MFATEDSWDEGGDNVESGIVNNPLPEKTPSRVQWHAILGLSDTPSSSLFGATSTPASTCADTSCHRTSASAPVHHDAMSTTDRPRLPEASLTPKAFGGSAAEMDNAERWLRYLNQYVQYRNLRDDEALTLFKLLLTDQAQDWLYALPEDQSDSFHRLQEAFMSRYTPNPLQRYQKASHMWSRMQQDNESVDSYFTSIISAANQIKLRDEQQLRFCLIRGLKPHLRLHVLQNNHDTLEDLQHSARVAEIASAGVVDNDKAVSELSKTVTLLVDKLTAKQSTTPPPAAPVVAAVTSDRGGSDRQQDRQRYTSSYNRRGQTGRQPQQPRQQYQRRFGYQTQDHMASGQGPPACGNCLLTHEANRCPAFAQTCYNCNRQNHFARACRSRPQQQQRYNQH
jgi:ribosomal protein L32E